MDDNVDVHLRPGLSRWGTHADAIAPGTETSESARCTPGQLERARGDLCVDVRRRWL